MLTKVTVRNFKRFREAEIELGNPVVFIGPNNSGKTSALQALALWEIGLRLWRERRKGRTAPEKRPGVTINRRDLMSLPVPAANLLWRDLHVRDIQKIGGKQETRNVRIDIIVEGVTEDTPWECGLEFDYANEQSFYCRPLRLSDDRNPDRMPIPDEAEKTHIAFLPPMSGLVANETRLDRGAINVRVGEGRTAEVLRNLCYSVLTEHPDKWKTIVGHITSLFRVRLDDPKYIAERGEVDMTYREHDTRLDLSSSGRGLQQTLLLLAYMYENPGAALLLDEPDAHLEIFRQRELYSLLADIASENSNQLIMASHSEVLLNEAADRDTVVAFVGNPHRIDDRGSQVRKALTEIGFEHYYQAEQTGWVLYLEGSTDLAILQAFAKKLHHSDAMMKLKRPFVHYVANQPRAVRTHFYGLQEAVPKLQGVALFDRLAPGLPDELGPTWLMWQRREIENYLCYPGALDEYARATAEATSPDAPLFSHGETERRLNAMSNAYRRHIPPAALEDRSDRWWSEVKASDDFLDRVFADYFASLGLPNLIRKTDYHRLAELVPHELISLEIKEKLDSIVEVARKASPLITEGE